MLVVWTGDRNQQVAACCERAEAAGVRVGMGLAHARSLLAGYRVGVLPFTPEEDARDLEKLSRWAMRFTPVAAVDPPDGLLLDIAGVGHLFGEEERLAGRIATSLGQMGLPCQICVAPTFVSAQAVARHGNRRLTFVHPEALREALAPLPVAALRVDPAVCAALGEVGVERIEQLLALCRDDLATRYGGELLRQLDRALGAAFEPVEPTIVERPIVVAKSFGGAARDGEVVAAAVRELLSALVEALEKNARGLTLLRIEFQRVHVDPVHLTLSLTYPTRDPVHLWSLIRPKVERVHLGHGVEDIRLCAERTARLVHEQQEFWPGGGAAHAGVDAASLGKLIDQLIDRLDRRSVTRVVSTESYLPERAFHRRPLDEDRSKPMGSVYRAPRPSRLLAAPEALNVVAVSPWGAPVWLNWRGRGGGVRFSLGPERIAPPWWEHGFSADPRDYYEVQDELGRFLWIFHDRGTSRWFVHGEWA